MKLKKLAKHYLTNNAYLSVTLIKDARPNKTVLTHTYQIKESCSDWLKYEVIQIEANDNGTLSILVTEPKNEIH